MKILVLPSWYPPKGGDFFRLQAETLVELGHTVKVAAQNEYSLKAFNGKFRVDYIENSVQVAEKKFYRIPKLNAFNEKRFIQSLVTFALKEAQKYQPDVLHVHSALWAGYAASIVKKKMNIPYVITEHRGRFTNLNNTEQLLKPNHYPLLQHAYENADSIIAVSTAIKSGINQLFQLKVNSVIVIPNIVDNHFFSRYLEVEKTNDVFTFIVVGNLEVHKGLNQLIEVVLVLKKLSKSTFKVVVAGSGSLKTILEQEIDANSLDREIKLLGFLKRDALIDELNKADALLSMAQFESFGVNIIEGFYSGLPVVATNSGGPADFVNETNGYLIENSIEDIATAMNEMILHIDSFDKNSIRNNAIAKFNKNTVGTRIEAALKQVIHE